MTNMEQTGDKLNDFIGRVLSAGTLMDECIYCGNTGRTKEDPNHCKHCGRDFKPQLSHDGVTEAEIQGVYIPKRYRETDAQWDPELIKSNLTERCDGSLPIQYKRFITRLDEIYHQIKEDNLDYINTQVVLCADRNYMDVLYIWAYSCIRASYQARLSTFNVLNVTQIETKGDKFDSLLEKDILFLELTNHDLDNSIYKMEYICSLRNRYDRNTYILTNIRDKRIARDNISISYDEMHKNDMDLNCNRSSLLKIIKQG